MPSTENIQAENSKETIDREVINGHESDCKDTSSAESSRESSQRKQIKVFGLSKKLRKETRKLLGYPGKAMKRSPSNDFVVNDTENVTPVLEGVLNIQEDFSCYFKQHDILMEFRYLCKNPPGGVYVVPSTKSLQVWHGIMFLRAGPFCEGIFRFDILLQDSFPNDAPLIRFTSDVFHPQIHKNGIINIEQAFPSWNKEHHIGDVLKYVKSCFFNINTGRALNDEAAKCVDENLEDFKRRARLCVEKSLREFEKESLVTSEDDGNLLKVGCFSAVAIEEWKVKILQKEHDVL